MKDKKTVDSIKRVAKELIGKNDDSEENDDDAAMALVVDDREILIKQ